MVVQTAIFLQTFYDGTAFAALPTKETYDKQFAGETINIDNQPGSGQISIPSGYKTVATITFPANQNRPEYEFKLTQWTSGWVRNYYYFECYNETESSSCSNIAVQIDTAASQYVGLLYKSDVEKDWSQTNDWINVKLKMPKELRDTFLKWAEADNGKPNDAFKKLIEQTKSGVLPSVKLPSVIDAIETGIGVMTEAFTAIIDTLSKRALKDLLIDIDIDPLSLTPLIGT